MQLEGDGTIIVPAQATERSQKGKLNYPSIQIVFQSKDFPLVTKICVACALGHGSIHKVTKSAAYVYTINSNEGCASDCFIHFINGYLRGPKYNQWVKLINYLNDKNHSIEVKSIDTSPIGSNSWLTGFIEADGSFQIRSTLDKTSRVRLGLSCVACALKLEGHATGVLH